MSINHVIILGCGRSGTSILGELFEHLDRYQYLFEPHMQSLERFRFGGRRLLAAKVPKSDEKDRTAGLPVDLAHLLDVLPDNHRFVWIVRHPLDAVCSLKPGIQDGWAHNPKPPAWEKYLERPLAERCARHWDYINDVGLDSLRRQVEPHIVRYEDLVAYPSETVEAILAAVGLDAFNPRKLDRYIGTIQDRTRGSYHAKHQELWYRDDHTKRLGRWRENLTDEEVRTCWPIVERTAESFRYSMD